jgi:uncharacterized protein involved in exopolysaccharide biosynthesis
MTIETISGSPAPSSGAGPLPTRPARARGNLTAALIVAVLVWFFITLSATVITFILPESYRAVARIKVERDPWLENQEAQSQSGLYSPSVYDPYFIQTEFEVIQSEAILGQVIDRLKLSERWGRRYNAGAKLTLPQTIGLLKRQIELRPIMHTSLIEISVFNERPEEAAEIANAIAEEFRAHRMKQLEALVRGQREILESAIKNHESKIAAVQTSLDRLRKELGITDEKARQAVESASATSNERPYWSKRRELEDLLRYQNTLSRKLLSEEQDNRLSAVGRVEIIDRAVPPLRPARPNKPLNIALGMLAGAIFGPLAGLATWVISRLIQRRRAMAG